MQIRDRINQFTTFLVAYLRCTRGGILLGRASGSGGPCQEIILGEGLVIVAGELRVVPVDGSPQPLELNAPPENPKITLTISGNLGGTVFPGLIQSGKVGGKLYFSAGGQWPPSGAIANAAWDSATLKWVLSTPALQWESSDNVATPDLVNVWLPRGVAVGTPIVSASAPVGGTVGKLNQKAFVTTTNASGIFCDEWTCTREAPVRWNPPAAFFEDRPSGALQRTFIDADGTQAWEAAYPLPS